MEIDYSNCFSLNLLTKQHESKNEEILTDTLFGNGKNNHYVCSAILIYLIF